MRALTWQGVNQLSVETVPDPRIVNPHDVVLRVRRSAVCGSGQKKGLASTAAQSQRPRNWHHRQHLRRDDLSEIQKVAQHRPAGRRHQFQLQPFFFGKTDDIKVIRQANACIAQRADHRDRQRQGDPRADLLVQLWIAPLPRLLGCRHKVHPARPPEAPNAD